jgi:hypothetical protein
LALGIFLTTVGIFLVMVGVTGRIAVWVLERFSR